MSIFNVLNNLKIRYKLLISYSLIFILAVSIASITIFSFLKKNLETNIESELEKSTESILNLVRTSASISIKNHLRSLADSNREVVRYFYNQSLKGEFSEVKAKEYAKTFLLSRTIGKTGYIYCADSHGFAAVHPKKQLVGSNFSQYDFVKEQTERKEGYLEYDWKNPDETVPRAKALYMTYFKPWDWIISVSSYRDEFKELIKIDDFSKGILSLKFGNTGYSYVVDSKGNVILHPKLVKLADRNFYHAQDADGRFFVKEMCEKKTGKVIYPWKNPDEQKLRNKLVIYNYLPEYDWIVASSSYLEEFYAPLNHIRNRIILSVMVALFLVIPCTFWISSSITNPLQQLMDRFNAGAAGNFSTRMHRDSKDEVGQLASYFNTFMEKIETYHIKLQGEIIERRQAETALRRSEEIFSKAFRSSPSGISITTLKSLCFIDVNDSFLAATGFERHEVIDHTLKELNFLTLDTAELKRVQSILEKSGRLQDYAVEFYTKSGEKRKGVFSAELIELWDEPCILTLTTDVTEAKKLEKKILDISVNERQKIGQDLHDDLCPHLIGIEVLSHILEKKLKEKEMKEASQARKIKLLINDAIRKTRGLSRGLCPVYLFDQGLEAALKEMADNVAEIFSLSCVFRCDSPVNINDKTVSTHLFYISQEAVHNAIKHGKAQKIIIHLFEKNGRITLEITDDGCGIQEKANPRGMGLHSMNYRAKMIGASFSVLGDLDNMTTIAISLGAQDKAGTEINVRESQFASV